MPKYKEEQESRYISRTVAILSELPEFCTVFYDKNQTTFLPKTQYDYMRAMRSFLTYQQQSHPYFNDRELADYTLDDLEHLTVKDANNFIEWLQQTMSVSSVKTRISCISSIFTFSIAPLEALIPQLIPPPSNAGPAEQAQLII